MFGSNRSASNKSFINSFDFKLAQEGQSKHFVHLKKFSPSISSLLTSSEIWSRPLYFFLALNYSIFSGSFIIYEQISPKVLFEPFRMWASYSSFLRLEEYFKRNLCVICNEPVWKKVLHVSVAELTYPFLFFKLHQQQQKAIHSVTGYFGDYCSLQLFTPSWKKTFLINRLECLLLTHFVLTY